VDPFPTTAPLAGRRAGTEASEPALELKGIKKSYDGVVALRGANLVCEYGRVGALMGENGAGKSTLVKILSGAITADEGEIRLAGQPLVVRSPAEAQRAGIVTVFQELSLIPDLTAADNLFYGIEPRVRRGRIDRRTLLREAEAAFARLGAEGIDPRRNVRDLSLANRQILEICKALVRRPRVLVLDEPTSALLPQQVDWLFRHVVTFAATGGAALFISHRLEEVERLASDVTVFRNGVDVGRGGIEEMPEDRLIELMLGRRVERVFPAAQPGSARTDLVCDIVGLASPPRLRAVSLQLSRGEILGVGGLQGQGQLELFLSLFGAIGHSGQVILDGHPVRLRRPSDALKAGVALIPEDRASEGLCLGLGIRDNISLSSLAGISRMGLISRRRENALVSSGVTQLSIKMRNARQEVSALSGGNQQKVLLARALSQRPRLLLMFDATRGVDVGTKSEIYSLMRDLCAQGVSVLFYSSDVFELANLSDRVVVMHDGQVRARLEGSDISEGRIIAASVGGLRDQSVGPAS
jgi:ribose transport system ATP-binding protein